MINSIHLPKLSILSFKKFIFTKEKEDQTDFIEGIKQNDQKILRKIYEQFLPMIVDLVRKNNGTESEARDVFQDALVVIYKKIKSGNFELTSSFKTYLFSVCRFIWLREIKKKHRQTLSLENTPEPSSNPELENTWLEQERQKLFKAKMELLPEESRKVLQMFFNKKSLKEIAQEMGYTTEYAKRKKYKAKQKLVDLIKNDPTYQWLLE